MAKTERPRFKRIALIKPPQLAASPGGIKNAFRAVRRRIISSASSCRVRLNVPETRSGPIDIRNGAPLTCAREKQIEVIAALCEGVGIRTAARLTGVNRGTVGSLALRVGLGCMELPYPRSPP
jgi:hypothetical protein